MADLFGRFVSITIFFDPSSSGQPIAPVPAVELVGTGTWLLFWNLVTVTDEPDEAFASFSNSAGDLPPGIQFTPSPQVQIDGSLLVTSTQWFSAITVTSESATPVTLSYTITALFEDTPHERPDPSVIVLPDPPTGRLKRRPLPQGLVRDRKAGSPRKGSNQG